MIQYFSTETHGDQHLGWFFLGPALAWKPGLSIFTAAYLILSRDQIFTLVRVQENVRRLLSIGFNGLMAILVRIKIKIAFHSVFQRGKEVEMSWLLVQDKYYYIFNDSNMGMFCPGR
jgi:hypothetical protein